MYPRTVPVELARRLQSEARANPLIGDGTTMNAVPTFMVGDWSVGLTLNR